MKFLCMYKQNDLVAEIFKFYKKNNSFFRHFQVTVKLWFLTESHPVLKVNFNEHRILVGCFFMSFFNHYICCCFYAKIVYMQMKTSSYPGFCPLFVLNIILIGITNKKREKAKYFHLLLLATGLPELNFQDSFTMTHQDLCVRCKDPI